jgi:hypothetical protein
MTVRSEERYHFHPPVTLDDEAKLRRDAGSYRYLCSLGGHAMFTHKPIGVVLHAIPYLRS